MRIAYWSRGNLRGYGGAEVCVAQLLNALCRRGEACFLLAHVPEAGASTALAPELDGRITVRQGHFANPFDHPKGPLDSLYKAARYLASSIALLAWLAKNRVDVIHQHFINLDVLILLAFKRLLGYRLVLTFHGMELEMAEGGRLATWKNRVALKYADEVTSVSPHQCVALSEAGGGRQVHFIPNALDADEIHRLAGQVPDVPVEAGHFVFCGRLEPVKQVPQLVDAFARAIRQGCTRNLYLVGDGRERKQVRSRIEELGLSKRVIHLGEMQRRQAMLLIRDSFCLVLNSSTEAYPLVILEAMALGRPVIAPRIGAIGQLLTDGESGLLFPALDPRALTECLLRLDRDPGLAGRLGNRASADYRQLATLDSVLDRYLQVYSG